MDKCWENWSSHKYRTHAIRIKLLPRLETLMIPKVFLECWRQSVMYFTHTGQVHLACLWHKDRLVYTVVPSWSTNSNFGASLNQGMLVGYHKPIRTLCVHFPGTYAGQQWGMVSATTLFTNKNDIAQFTIERRGVNSGKSAWWMLNSSVWSCPWSSFDTWHSLAANAKRTYIRTYVYIRRIKTCG